MTRLIPYSAEVYGHILSDYAARFRWAECLAILLLAGCMIAVRRGLPWGTAAGVCVLAVTWAGLGFGFYGTIYQPFNWVGTYFGILTGVQAGLLGVWIYCFGSEIKVNSSVSWLGAGILALAAAQGALVWSLTDHTAPIAQAMGLTPLATITATLGWWVFSTARPVWWLLPIPVLLVGWEAVRAHVFGLVSEGVLIGVSVLCIGILVRRG